MTAQKKDQTTKDFARVAEDQFRSGFDAFQNYTQTYADLATETTRRVLEQTLAVRAGFDQVVKDTVKKSQDLYAEEQELMLESMETFQNQLQQASERVAKLFGTKAR